MPFFFEKPALMNINDPAWGFDDIEDATAEETVRPSQIRSPRLFPRVRSPRGPGRKPGASCYTRKRLSLSLSHTRARAKAWCLLIHAECLSLTRARAKAWRLLIHAEASLSLDPRSLN